MLKYIVTILAVVVIAVVGIAYAVAHKADNSSSNTSQPSAYPNSQPSQSAPSGTVNIRNMMFTPSQITVQKGATVTWTNNDTMAHTITDDLSDVGGPASGEVQPGSSYSFKFEKSGSFQYHCNIHHSMRGTIVVK